MRLHFCGNLPNKHSTTLLYTVTWVGPCESLNPDRWEITPKMHLKTILIDFWKIHFEFWNAAVAWKHPSPPPTPPVINYKLQYVAYVLSSCGQTMRIWKIFVQVFVYELLPKKREQTDCNGGTLQSASLQESKRSPCTSGKLTANLSYWGTSF